MNTTADFWRGSFGDAYTARNRVNWRARIPFWKMILDETGARSIFEFGCNAGWNLSAIQRIDPLIGVAGIDVNSKAITNARRAGLVETEDCGGFLIPGGFDLVMTVGVLIHIAPDDIHAMMRDIAAIAEDYVLAVEYEADKEEEVMYRGNSGKLWRRPFGKLYQDLGLKLVKSGIVGREDGFDDCSWWLLRK